MHFYIWFKIIQANFAVLDPIWPFKIFNIDVDTPKILSGINDEDTVLNYSTEEQDKLMKSARSISEKILEAWSLSK